MATALGTVLQNLRRTLRPEVERCDGELLESFVTQRDEDAFTALVRWHGPMVLGVCRRVLHNEADVEDAFQATFFVLARKAATIRPRHMVGNWLYGVAHTTALKAKAMNTKRAVKEREALRPTQEESETWPELRTILDQELKALPERYRAALVLCDLEGLTIKDAARQLGCPQGTIGTRLARGRVLLARRLAQRGLSVSGGLLASLLAQHAIADVPQGLMNTTIQTATVGGSQSATVAALTESVIMQLFVTKIKTVLTGLLVGVIGFATLSIGASASEGQKAPKEEPPPKNTEPRPAESAKKPATNGEEISAIWITEKRVQEELRLTAEQVKKIGAIRTNVWKKHDAALKEAQEEVKKHNYGRYHELSRKVQTEERKALTEGVPDIISASALKRLLQIQRQARGLHEVVRDPAVQKKLNLSDEQMKKIEGFLKQGLEKSRKEAVLRAGGPIYFPLAIEDHVVTEQKAYADSMKSVLEVFMDDQKRVWNDLVGEAFAFKASSVK
jgi:RNA polymerase sigma factor (sigma-70 family)